MTDEKLIEEIMNKKCTADGQQHKKCHWKWEDGHCIYCNRLPIEEVFAKCKEDDTLRNEQRIVDACEKEHSILYGDFFYQFVSWEGAFWKGDDAPDDIDVVVSDFRDAVIRTNKQETTKAILKEIEEKGEYKKINELQHLMIGVDDWKEIKKKVLGEDNNASP